MITHCCVLEAPLDYQAVTQQLRFTRDITRIPIMIPIQSDQLDEDNETFQTMLEQDPSMETVSIQPATAIVTIVDDDGEHH